MGHFIYAEDLICVQGGKESFILYLLKTDPLNLCFQLKLIPGPLKPSATPSLSCVLHSKGFAPLGLVADSADTSAYFLTYLTPPPHQGFAV